MTREKAVEITLTGTVTGVGLRLWVRGLAQRLGLRGWVRNNVDRTVTIHAEGDEQVLTSFGDQLRRPSLERAAVTDVQVRDVELHGYSDFSVERG